MHVGELVNIHTALGVGRGSRRQRPLQQLAPPPQTQGVPASCHQENRCARRQGYAQVSRGGSERTHGGVILEPLSREISRVSGGLVARGEETQGGSRVH